MRSRRSPALARANGYWLHVDGAFGLWAAASPELRERVAGVEQADSWATDAHKWLNVPYDCGLAFVADADAHRAAMAMTAEYLVADSDAARDAMDWTPEFSRRARGVAVYAALRSLGRDGRRGARRTLLPTRAPLRRRARSTPRLRDPERGRPEPGAPALRRRRDDPRRARVGAEKRRGLDERDDVGRTLRDPHLGFELADERHRRLAHRGRVRATLAGRPDLARRATPRRLGRLRGRRSPQPPRDPRAWSCLRAAGPRRRRAAACA